MPSIFVEFSDSEYKMTEDPVEVFNRIKNKYPKIKHIVVTGENYEPLRHRKELEQFLINVSFEDCIITVETDGTWPILNPLHKGFKVDLYIIKSNCSEFDFKNKVDIVMSARDYQFIFDYSEECEHKIDEIYTKMAVVVENMTNGDYIRSYYFNNHPNKHTAIIGNGGEELCIKRGWQYINKQ